MNRLPTNLFLVLDYDNFLLGSSLIKIHIANVNAHKVIGVENGGIYLICRALIVRIIQ